MYVNNLDGALPAELGKLTDLESLCAALRCRRAAHRRDRSAPRSHAPAVVRSDCSRNRHDGAEGFSGTVGSWIGSMAKLAYL